MPTTTDVTNDVLAGWPARAMADSEPTRYREHLSAFVDDQWIDLSATTLDDALGEVVYHRGWDEHEWTATDEPLDPGDETESHLIAWRVVGDELEPAVPCVEGFLVRVQPCLDSGGRRV